MSSVDSGWSWVYLCGASTIMFLWIGLPKALAVLLPTLTDQFDTYTWTIGMMISSIMSIRDFSAPVVGALTTADNLRTFALAGGIVSGLSLITASFARNLLVLVILTSVVSGVSYAFILVPCYTILGRNFDKYYPLATGVFHASGTLGVMVQAPGAQLLLTTYGWRNTVLLLGAIYLHLVVAASVFRTPYADLESSARKDLQDLNYAPSDSSKVMDTSASNSSTVMDTAPSDSTTVSNLADSTSPKNSSRDADELFGWMSEYGECSQSRLDKLWDQIGMSLFNNRSFVAVSIMMASANGTWTGWIVYFVPNCLVKGPTLYQATFLVSAAGFANLIGHIIYVPIVVGNIVSVRGCVYIAGTLSTVALLVDKFTVTVTSISVSTLLYTFGIGIAYPLYDVLIKDAVGTYMLAKAFGLRIVMSGVMRLIIGFVVGWIYDTTKSYAIGYFLLTAIQALGVTTLVVDQLLKKLKEKPDC